MILPSTFRKISFKLSPTFRSDIVKFGTSAFVLSDNKTKDPVATEFSHFSKLAGSPTGVKSNLKSPVWTILPDGVLTTTPKASGILWVVRKKDTDVFRNLMMSSSLIQSFSSFLISPCSSSLLLSKSERQLTAVNRNIDFRSK